MSVLPQEHVSHASPLRRYILSAFVPAAATLGVGLAVRYGALAAGSPPVRADVLTLMAMTVWIALAAAPLAAGAQRAFGALIRAGVMADIGALGLLVMALTGPVVTWSVAWRTYLLWAGLAVAAAGVVRLADRRLAQAALALAFSAVAFAACASPIWSDGLILHLQGPWRQAAGDSLAAVNPLLGLSRLLRPIGFVWSEQPVLYGLTRMGQDYAIPAVGWHAPALVWWALAAAAWTACLLRRAWQAFWWGN